MDCILTIIDEDFGLESIPLNNPRIRYGARGIIFNSENKVAILNKEKKNEYKLVGGGIEELEDPIKAFKREALEESGCKIEIDDCLGYTKEIKSLDNFEQISRIYVAHVIEDAGHTDYTQKEQDEGAKILWLDIDDALRIIEECENKLQTSQYENIYQTKFIVRRDAGILRYYKNHYLNHKR